MTNKKSQVQLLAEIKDRNRKVQIIRLHGNSWRKNCPLLML